MAKKIFGMKYLERTDISKSGSALVPEPQYSGSMKIIISGKVPRVTPDST